MKHCMMYYAGYQHVSCDRQTHTHLLRNLQNNQIEVWKTVGRDGIGIPYKNTKLAFYGFLHEYYERMARNEQQTNPGTPAWSSDGLGSTSTPYPAKTDRSDVYSE